MRPVAGAGDEAVADRVEVDIVNMALQVALVADRVLPVFRLEDPAPAVAATAPGGSPLLAGGREPIPREAGLDLAPPTGVVSIAGRKGPDGVEVVGQQDDRRGAEWSPTATHAQGLAQDPAGPVLFEDRARPSVTIVKKYVPPGTKLRRKFGIRSSPSEPDVGPARAGRVADVGPARAGRVATQHEGNVVQPGRLAPALRENISMPGRRPLDFDQIDAVMTDVDRLLAGHTTSGQWTLAMICDHLTRAARVTLRGRVTGAASTPEQDALRLQFFADRAIPEGRALPIALLEPDPDMDAPAAAESLREVLARLGAHQGPWPHHPALGPLTGDEWRQFHAIHCAHHLSFAHPA